MHFTISFNPSPSLLYELLELQECCELTFKFSCRRTYCSPPDSVPNEAESVSKFKCFKEFEIDCTVLDTDDYFEMLEVIETELKLMSEINCSQKKILEFKKRRRVYSFAKAHTPVLRAFSSHFSHAFCFDYSSPPLPSVYEISDAPFDLLVTMIRFSYSCVIPD